MKHQEALKNLFQSVSAFQIDRNLKMLVLWENSIWDSLGE